QRLAVDARAARRQQLLDDGGHGIGHRAREQTQRWAGNAVTLCRHPSRTPCGEGTSRRSSAPRARPSAAFTPLCLVARLMAWPLMFSTAGITYGTDCEPTPSEIASGMGGSMCVASVSPLIDRSRIIADEADLEVARFGRPRLVLRERARR